MPNRLDPIAFPPGLDTSFQGVVGRLMGGLVAGGVASDDTPGSVARTLVETFARELATFYEVLSRAHAAGYLETAEGDALDQVVALLGIARGRAGRLAGKVSLSRNTAALATINIPAGLRISGRGPDGKALPAFEVVADAELLPDALSVLVDVQEAPDQDTSEISSIEKGNLTVLPRPLLGVERATNPEPVTRAGVDETDDALRARARVALRVGERSTAEALAAAAREAGAVSVSVEEVHDGPAGRVIVRIADPDLQGDAERLDRVRKALDRTRAAGVRVELALIRAIRFEPVVEIALDNPDLSESDQKALKEAVSAAVIACIAALPPETSIQRRKVEGAVLSVSGVAEARLLPGTTTRPLQDDGSPGPADGLQRLSADESTWQIVSGERAAMQPKKVPPIVQIRALPTLTVSLSARTLPNALSAEGWRAAVRSALGEAWTRLPATGAARSWRLSTVATLLAERAFVAEIRSLSFSDADGDQTRLPGDDRPVALPEGARLVFGTLSAVTGPGAAEGAA